MLLSFSCNKNVNKFKILQKCSKGDQYKREKLELSSINLINELLDCE